MIELHCWSESHPTYTILADYIYIYTQLKTVFNKCAIFHLLYKSSKPFLKMHILTHLTDLYFQQEPVRFRVICTYWLLTCEALGSGQIVTEQKRITPALFDLCNFWFYFLL